jgi:heme/copper-type cytochrome/quinol oxidase subunit 2
MSRNQRIVLVVAAVAVVVVAFVIVSPGSDDEDESRPAAQNTPAETPTETQMQTEAEGEPEPPPKPTVTRIDIQGGQVQGGAKRIEVTQGESVRIVVNADSADEIHLHGYDLTREAAPGAPARFRFKANLEGVFEMESHTAEDAGLEPLVANVVVNPS